VQSGAGVSLSLAGKVSKSVMPKTWAIRGLLSGSFHISL
jgi:hypothetical protein